MARCLVTGGNGFIGRYLVRELERGGNDVITLTSKPVGSDQLGQVQVRLGHDPVPETLMVGIDIVFHLANIAHANLASEQSYLYQQINVQGTNDLLKAAVQAGVQKFVYISSVKAGEGKLDNYGCSKLQTEELVRSFARDYGLWVSIVRPALVYGPGVKGNLNSMISSIKDRKFPWNLLQLPEFGNVRSMVSVQDLVEAILLVADSPLARDKSYIVADSELYTPAGLQRAIAGGLGRRVSLIVVPRWLFSGAALVGEMLQKALRRELPFNRVVYEKLRQSARYNAEDIRSDLGWAPRRSFFSELPAMLDFIDKE